MNKRREDLDSLDSEWLCVNEFWACHFVGKNNREWWDIGRVIHIKGPMEEIRGQRVRLDNKNASEKDKIQVLHYWFKPVDENRLHFIHNNEENEILHTYYPLASAMMKVDLIHEGVLFI